MKDVSRQTLQDLLEFIYNGEVDVNQHDVENFMSTAKALEIKGLTDDRYAQFYERPSTAPNGKQYQSSHTLWAQGPSNDVKYCNSVQSSYFQYHPANDFQQQTGYDGVTVIDAHGYDDGENMHSLDVANENLSIDQEFVNNQNGQYFRNVDDENKSGGLLSKTCPLKAKRAKSNYSELIQINIIILSIVI